MPPKGPGKSRRRPRRSASSRPSIRALLLVVALPFMALVVWLGYRFLESPQPAAEPPATVNATQPDAGPAVTATIVETPRIEAALLHAGIERDRLRWENGHLVVETFDTVETIHDTLEREIPGSIVERDGEMLSVSHDEIVEHLRVLRLQRDTEDAGFIPTDEGATEPVVPVAPPTGGRKIVLILDDVGYENQPLDSAAMIDARISFAVIPGTPRARQSAEFLSSRGFEILCHLPMEPLDYPNVSPGDRAIFTTMQDEEIRTLASENIDSIPGVKGVNNHMGSRATRDRRVMKVLADVLRQKGVYFVDSRTAGSSVAAQVTRDAKIPTGSRDVFLDDDPAEIAVRRQLRLLAALSDKRDFVVGIGHVYPTTVRVLREEIPKLTDAGYEFLFASDVLR